MATWASELETFVEAGVREQRFAYKPSEMLPPFEDGELCGFDPITTPEEKAAELEKAEAAYRAEYGDDPRVLDLLCDETAVDLNTCLWHARRTEEIEHNVRVFYDYCYAHRVRDAYLLGMWLLELHTDYGMEYDPRLLHDLRLVTSNIRDMTSNTRDMTSNTRDMPSNTRDMTSNTRDTTSNTRDTTSLQQSAN
ncbi:hypothetical protein T484DRAFT_1753461 [Baffinella frigidus]|nr:hypothetical protein T484DRAFT_1753461 [Cryptophyta sp. CCMP2293]